MNAMKRYRSCLMVSFLSLLLWACTSSGMPLPTETSAPGRTLAPSLVAPAGTLTPDPLTGTINGQVIDATNGSPVASANISTDPPTSSAVTDAQGVYSITGVPTGSYAVIFNKSGYRNTAISIYVGVDRVTQADILAEIPSAIVSKVDYSVLFHGRAGPRPESAYVLVQRQEGLTQQWQECNLPGFAPTVDFEQSTVVFLCEPARGNPLEIEIGHIVRQERVIWVYLQYNNQIWDVMGDPIALVIVIHKTQMPIELYRVENSGWGDPLASQRIVPVSD